ncbi:hypothetical protein, partial [Deinococcus aquaticus]|uniref:hypothetical protein n=1 Tax=Deinococcus aquaticus TaxID=328692 RepID=UPI003F48D858
MTRWPLTPGAGLTSGLTLAALLLAGPARATQATQEPLTAPAPAAQVTDQMPDQTPDLAVSAEATRAHLADAALELAFDPA